MFEENDHFENGYLETWNKVKQNISSYSFINGKTRNIKILSTKSFEKMFWGLIGFRRIM